MREFLVDDHRAREEGALAIDLDPTFSPTLTKFLTRRPAVVDVGFRVISF
jgi:hypothetical protein